MPDLKLEGPEERTNEFQLNLGTQKTTLGQRSGTETQEPLLEVQAFKLHQVVHLSLLAYWRERERERARFSSISQLSLRGLL
jgi:hypothetical protein